MCVNLVRYAEERLTLGTAKLDIHDGSQFDSKFVWWANTDESGMSQEGSSVHLAHTIEVSESHLSNIHVP